MPRSKGRVKKPRRLALPIIEDVPDEEADLVEDDGFDAEEPARLAPEKDEDGRQVYFRKEPGGPVQSFSRENYGKLKGFIDSLPERNRFGIFVYRVVDGKPGEAPKRRWEGKLELPEGVLEPAVEEAFGGGEYYWQLAFDGRYASKDDIPGDLDDVKLSGNLSIGGPPKAKAAEVEEKQEGVRELVAEIRSQGEASKSAVLDILKEQLKEAKGRDDAAGKSMVQLMTVLMAGMQQQQQMAQTLAQQQTGFMMQMMQLNDAKSKEQMTGREALYKEIIELLREFGGGRESGEPESIGGSLVKHMPQILEKLSQLPGLQQVSPRKEPAPAIRPLPPLPTLPPPPAPAVPAAPVAPVSITPAGTEGFGPDDNQYLTEVVAQVWELFKKQARVEDAADYVSDLGTERQYAVLLQQSSDWVSALVKTAWEAFQGATPLPEGLLAYARAVHMEICREEPPIPASRFPAEKPSEGPTGPTPAASTVFTQVRPLPPVAPPPAEGPTGGPTPPAGQEATPKGQI